MRAIGYLALALALVLALGSPVSADERLFGLDALRGLTALQVLVEPISLDAEKDGVKRSTLQADMELRLRRAGIGVVTDRSVPVLESAVLRLRLDDLKRDLEQGSYHEFRLTLEVIQDVQLVRDPAVQASSAAWSRTMGGTRLSATLVASVRGALRQEMEHLLDDYLAANGGAVRRLAAKKSRARPEGD